MEKCPICKEYVYTDLKHHKCKTKWYCFDADIFKVGVIPTPEEFLSYGISVLADNPEDAAIEYVRRIEEKRSDYFDETNVLVLEKDIKVYKYTVNAETTRAYYVNKPEIIELKIDDTKDNPKLFEF